MKFAVRPRISWKGSFGSFQARNNIVTDGKSLFFGTAAREYARESLASVYALDAGTGELRWKVTVEYDVNAVELRNDRLIATTDSGLVIVLDADTGAVIRDIKFRSPVVGRPIFLDDDYFVIVTLKGTLAVNSIDRRAVPYTLSAGSKVWADPFKTKLGIGIVTARGTVIELVNDGRLFEKRMIGSVREAVNKTVRAKWDLWKFKEVFASCVRRGDGFVGGYVRDTYGEAPPLYAFDMSGNFKPFSGSNDVHFGNCRTIPLSMGDNLFVAFAYSKGIDVFDKRLTHLKRIPLGRNVFQQWSSPVKVNNDTLAIGRVDGVLSFVDTSENKLAASVSLSVAEEETYGESDSRWVHENYPLYPSTPPRGGICSTPLVLGRSVFAATTDGQLFKIDF